MNCYTIGNDVQDGIVAKSKGMGWYVTIGHDPVTTVIPLAKRKGEALNRFMSALERRTGGETKYIDLLDRDKVTTEEEAAESIEEIERDGLGIYRLDFKEGELIDTRGPEALVHVATCVNKDKGNLVYLANSFDEMVENGRTVRKNHSFDRAAGIQVVAQGQGFFGEPHGLIRMLPNSSFRLKQEKPAPGSWFELVLSWNGREINHKLFTPRRGRPSGKRKK